MNFRNIGLVLNIINYRYIYIYKNVVEIKTISSSKIENLKTQLELIRIIHRLICKFCSSY